MRPAQEYQQQIGMSAMRELPIGSERSLPSHRDVLGIHRPEPAQCKRKAQEHLNWYIVGACLDPLCSE